MEKYKIAFGKDFNLGIDVPDYFEDISWKNDVCPSFSLSPLDNVVIALWVDYEDTESRELGEDALRYTVCQYINEEFDRELFSTESPTEIINYLTSEVKPNEINK